MPDEDVSVETQIAAAAERLYDLVSDVTRMGQWSPETTGCKWVGGASGPAPGARFRGTNRAGWRRWMTQCRVLEAERGRRFAFDVGVGPIAVSRWTYLFEPAEGGTRVTESWHDRRGEWMVGLSARMMGVSDRREHNRLGMEQTLANLKGFAESENP
jgi:uncharacterized protein YndB with AHSA1/START domain